jgi:Holliday junction resolvase RusA-like endonuclease
MTGEGKIATQSYVPKKHPVSEFKLAVRESFAKVWSGGPLEGPVMMGASFVLPRPASMNRKRVANVRVWDTRGRRNDFDNLIKSTMDALNQLAFGDDSQVAGVVGMKFIAAQWEQPHALIVLGTDVSLWRFYEILMREAETGGAVVVGGECGSRQDDVRKVEAPAGGGDGELSVANRQRQRILFEGSDHGCGGVRDRLSDIASSQVVIDSDCE